MGDDKGKKKKKEKISNKTRLKKQRQTHAFNINTVMHFSVTKKIASVNIFST